MRLTPQREQEIRMWLATRSIIASTELMISELLSEIDAQREELANIRLELEWPIVKERDQLQASLKACRLVRQEQDREICDLKKELAILNAEIDKLRNALAK